MECACKALVWVDLDGVAVFSDGFRMALDCGFVARGQRGRGCRCVCSWNTNDEFRDHISAGFIVQHILLPNPPAAAHGRIKLEGHSSRILTHRRTVFVPPHCSPNHRRFRTKPSPPAYDITECFKREPHTLASASATPLPAPNRSPNPKLTSHTRRNPQLSRKPPLHLPPTGKRRYHIPNSSQ